MKSITPEYSEITDKVRMHIEQFNSTTQINPEYFANLEIDQELKYASKSLFFTLTAFVYRQEIDEIYHEYPASFWDTIKFYLPPILKKLFKPPIMKKLKIEYSILYPQIKKREFSIEHTVFAFKSSDLGFGELK